MDLRQIADISLRRKLHHLVLHLGVDAGALPAHRVQRLAQEVGPLCWLDVHGGDPFLRSDLAALVGAFRAEVLTLVTPAQDVAAVVDGARRVRRERGGEVVVALTLDGLMPTQDALHGPGAWDRLWAAFDALRALDEVRVELRTALSAQNLDEALALAEYGWRQGPDAHVVVLPGGADAEALEPPRLRALEGPLFAVLDRYAPDDGRLLSRLRRHFHRLRWATAVRTLQEGRQVIPCLAGLAHAVVRSNGDVASCELLPALGNLADRPWADIWSGDALRAQREYIGAGGCHCTDDCAMHDSIVLRPQNLPRLLAG
ncbi:SPASM domain-containing protein [Myxococcota bacterium]|nr:SPASM domain-containing protein [Myxococcota bacterium]